MALLQPKLNLDREPRFYSTLGFDRGYNRTWEIALAIKNEERRNSW